jgi:hypothetical protein
VAEDELTGWRGIDALAALVGHYGWLEWRIFELTGDWAARPSGDAELKDAELAVWCAAVARRHGDLATRWAERLPVRAGVDAGALVRAPSPEVATALERLGGLPDAGAALGVLVATVLPWLGAIYGAHLETASPVREAPVAEVLVESRRNALGETWSGRSVVRNLCDGVERAARAADLVTDFEQVFDNLRVFPAVRAS